MENQGVQIWAGDQVAVGGNVQGDLQQVPAVQAENGAAICADVADLFQFCLQTGHRVQGGGKDDVVDFAGGIVLFVDVADSPASRKRTVPRQAAGTSAATPAAYSSFSRNSPSSAGSSLARISASQPGCAMSPVPTMFTPFNCAHFHRCSKVRSALVARL